MPLLAGLAAAGLVLFLTTPGLRFSLRLAARILPGDLTVSAVHGRLIDTLHLEGVTYRDPDLEVAARNMTLSWRPAALLRRTCVISSVRANGMTVRLQEDSTPPAATSEREALSSFTMPLALEIEQAAIDSLDLILPGNPIPVHIASLRLEQTVTRGSQLRIGALNLTGADYQLGIAGEIRTGPVTEGRLTVETTFTPPGYSPLTAQAQFQGTQAQVAVHVDLVQPISATLEGTLTNPTDQAGWSAEFRADQARLAHISPDWPDLVLEEIRATGSGTLADYALEVEADAEHKLFRDLHLRTRIEGNEEGLRFTDTHFSRADSTLDAEGRMDWRQGFAWQVRVDGTAIDPGAWHPDWPGRLDLRLLSAGNMDQGRLRGDLDLQALTGTLRAYPLRAEGKIGHDGDALTIDHLVLETPGSTLRASGHFAETADIGFTLESANLASLWPGAAGRVQAEGRLSGKRRQASLAFNLTGDRVSLNDLTLKTVTAEAETSLAPDGVQKAKVRATGIALGDTLFDDLTAELLGTTTAHQLRVDLASGVDAAHLQLAGGLAGSAWHGTLDRADLRQEYLGSWSLHAPAALSFSVREITTQPLCLAGSSTARLCVEGRWQPETWQSVVRLEAIPLHLLWPGHESKPAVEGTLAGLVDLQGDRTGIRSGHLDLATDSAALTVTLPEIGPRRLVWHNNTLQAALTDRQLTATLNSILADGSTLVSSLRLQDFQTVPLRLAQGQLAGEITFAVKDLQPLGLLTLPYLDPSGALQGNFVLRGPAARPTLSGTAQLVRGTVKVPPLGIALEELELEMEGKGPDYRAVLTGTSGNGRARAEGQLRLAESTAPELAFRLQGERFAAVRLPEFTVLASPTLQGILTRDRGEISGTVLIPEARIAPRRLTGSVSPSRDVVIVGSLAESGKAGWPLAARVSLVAGEEVRVDAFGLKGRVRGRLEVTALPDKPVTGEGVLSIADGTFSVYGRELAIKTGRLLYSGNPLDNPGVDVRAENTASEVTTGIQVSGFLGEPEISFYSTPPMEENAIISRLLLNTSLVASSDQEQGLLGRAMARTGLAPVTATVRGIKESLRLDEVKIATGKQKDELSLVVGTWLTPELYISYGKNLLKDAGSFNTRYLLGYGFSVQTETGATQSGADLKYEIDR